MAFSSEDIIHNFLRSDLPQLTPSTIVDPQVISAELEEIRKTAFAFDFEGNRSGINAFAVPLFDRDGLPVAAIVAAGSANIVTWQEKTLFVKALQASATKICSLLINGTVTSL